MSLTTRFFKREKHRRVVDALLLMIRGAALLVATFRATYILWFLVFS